ADGAGQREAFIAALQRVPVLARGPKPVAALREAGLQATIVAPEPNTWHELLSELDRSGIQVAGKRVAVQEYGEPSDELIGSLQQRGAEVTPIPVYQWALPADTRPVENALAALERGEIEVALFMAAVQVQHLFQIAEHQIAEEKTSADRLRQGL